MAKLTKAHKARTGVTEDLLAFSDAIKLVKDNAKAKFDESIEIAINLGVDPRHADQQVRGVVNLPSGTGRDVRVAVFAKDAKAAEATPPIQRMLAEGVPVGAGTDATRVASYNPWTALYWMVSGKTVGGLELQPHGLSRETALQLFTHGSAWFSSEQGKKGQIRVGQLADLTALSAD